ncbi:MAG: hypothetical protein FD127_3433 [Acidimicrobiaceae bacterium]|nr:MAG: hypothetical protein FD127_3433 [Acidimicrobiaceae bacterium]
MDDPSRVDHIGIAADAVEKSVDDGSFGDVADDHRHTGIGGERHTIGGFTHQHAQRPAGRVGEQPVHQRATEPTGGARDDRRLRRDLDRRLRCRHGLGLGPGLGSGRGLGLGG